MTRGRRLKAMRLVIAIGLLLAVASPAVADVLKVGDRAAELDVAVDGNDRPFRLKSLKGKWVLVTMGADWCGPCKKELPTWDKVAGDVKGKVTFVAINVNNDKADGKKFNKKLKLANMTLVYMPEEKSGVAPRYGAETMPSSFLIDPQGVVRLVRAGFDERDAAGESKRLKADFAKLVK
ncbi:MAG: TlpA disulfide reductase family protein [Kofleriaceae bacterium]